MPEGGEVGLNKVQYRQDMSQGPTPNLFICHLARKGTLFIYILLKKKMMTQSQIVQSVMQDCQYRNILIKGPFKYLNDQCPYPFIYLNF